MNLSRVQIILSPYEGPYVKVSVAAYCGWML